MKGQLPGACSPEVKGLISAGSEQMNAGPGPQGSWSRPNWTPTRGGGELGLRPRGGAARTGPARSRDRDALTSRAPFPTAAMGNIQKKLMVRSEGSRRSRRARTPGPRAEQQGGLPETATAGTGDKHHPEEPRAADSPADLKSRGNELFRGGQFAEAAAQYSVAIAQLEPTGRGAAVTGAGPRSFPLTKGMVSNTSECGACTGQAGLHGSLSYLPGVAGAGQPPELCRLSRL